MILVQSKVSYHRLLGREFYNAALRHNSLHMLQIAQANWKHARYLEVQKSLECYLAQEK